MNHVCTTITAISAYYIFFFYRAASLHLGVRPINERYNTSAVVTITSTRIIHCNPLRCLHRSSAEIRPFNHLFNQGLVVCRIAYPVRTADEHVATIWT
jgi:hypothetical protein